MSTNNNHFSRESKEVKPRYKNAAGESQKIKLFSGLRLQPQLLNSLSDCNAATLSNRGIQRIEDLVGFGERLRRLDLSKNELSRLASFVSIPNLSLLNISSNRFSGDSGLEDLRYLSELRTLNIGYNPQIKQIRTHIVKPLVKLQALIANDCGLEKASFLKFLPVLNTIVLSKNRLRDFAPPDVGQLSLLEKLSVGHNLLQKIPDLSSCPCLHELRINNNSISTISEQFIAFAAKRIKTLDLSKNRIASWEVVAQLTRIEPLTNLSLVGNPLPAPPRTVEDIELREDRAAEKMLSSGKAVNEDLVLYRRYVLSLFQRRVGALQKLHVQLIVLDNKRVKDKWSHGGAAKACASGTRGSEATGGDGYEYDYGEKEGEGTDNRVLGNGGGTGISSSASRGGGGGGDDVGIVPRPGTKRVAWPSKTTSTSTSTSTRGREKDSSDGGGRTGAAGGTEEAVPGRREKHHRQQGADREEDEEDEEKGEGSGGDGDSDGDSDGDGDGPKKRKKQREREKADKKVEKKSKKGSASADEKMFGSRTGFLSDDVADKNDDDDDAHTQQQKPPSASSSSGVVAMKIVSSLRHKQGLTASSSSTSSSVSDDHIGAGAGTGTSVTSHLGDIGLGIGGASAW